MHSKWQNRRRCNRVWPTGRRRLSVADRPLSDIDGPIQNASLRSFGLTWNDAGFIWVGELSVPGEDGRRDAKR